MKDMSTYLTFDGNCRQAMEFYKKCLGGELFFMPVGESPVEAPKEAKDRIMHASLKIGSISLLAADSWMNQPLHTGNNFAICIVPESLQETKRLFAALSENGKVGMEMINAIGAGVWPKEEGVRRARGWQGGTIQITRQHCWE